MSRLGKNQYVWHGYSRLAKALGDLQRATSPKASKTKDGSDSASGPAPSNNRTRRTRTP